MKSKHAADPLARGNDGAGDLAGTLFGSTRPTFEPRDIELPGRRCLAPVDDTSKAALHHRHRGGDRTTVLQLLVQAPRTLDELCALMKKPANALTGRLKELKDAGLVVKTEAKRKTRSNVNARIWSATGAGIAATQDVAHRN